MSTDGVSNEKSATQITGISVHDVRFPTSQEAHGSDAVHTDPDYSVTYVVLETNSELKGYGTTFTIGRGNEIVCECVKALEFLVVGTQLQTILSDFSGFWRKLTNEPQLRWIGPEKGVLHLATAAVVNAIWDLWGKLEGKPVWKLLVDMSPDQLLSIMDFTYITDVISREEAREMLTISPELLEEREQRMRSEGYPAYTTAAGWLGYTDERIRMLCKKFMDDGWNEFKVKVGQNLLDDKRRLRAIRETIGDRVMMVDANQRWGVEEAIYWMQELAEFQPLWIEEPTSPDDINGHKRIADVLNPLGIGVATGEMCQNKVMFKQFLQTGAMQYCQIDSCRLGSINEILPVYLMAAKLNIPVCPHAGGVCLNEMVQHLQMFDYIRITGTTENRRVEYVDHLAENLETPAVCQGPRYMPPTAPGYSCKLKDEALQKYTWPNGIEWKRLIEIGVARNTRI